MTNAWVIILCFFRVALGTNNIISTAESQRASKLPVSTPFIAGIKDVPRIPSVLHECWALNCMQSLWLLSWAISPTSPPCYRGESAHRALGFVTPYNEHNA